MQAGDLVEVNFGVPIGSEPGFVRPAIVITANLVLQSQPRTVYVVPLTTNMKRAMPSEVPVDVPILKQPSTAQCHLCTAISTQRIGTNLGNIGVVLLTQIRSVVADLLDLEG